MLEAVVWPHDCGPTVIDGWEFDSGALPGEIVGVTEGVDEPVDFVPGSQRWAEWRLGRQAACQVAARMGVSTPVVEVEPSGAPRIKDSTVCVSIAHTRGVVLAAAAPDAIGIDVERADRNVSRLVRALHPGEVDISISLGVVASLVAKESVAKATGLGLGGSLARWPLIDAELSGATPCVSVATPDNRIVTAQLFPWKDFIVGIARL